MRGEDQLSRLIYELCALLFAILRGPHLAIPSSDGAGHPRTPPPPLRIARTTAGGRQRPQISPAGFASLLLGASLAMMLCGSVTFVIGLILMPWVLGILGLFYFIGFLSSLSGIGRAIFFPAPVPTGRTSPSRPTIFQTSNYLDMKWQLMTE